MSARPAERPAARPALWRPSPHARDGGRSGVLPLTILAGLDRAAVADIGAGLLLRLPRLALIWADPFTAELGYIQTRVTDSYGRCTERTVELEHGCLSCAMRDGVVRAIRGLAATGRYTAVLVHLHPGIETDVAARALDAELAGTARVDSVVGVLSQGWLDRLAGEACADDVDIAVAPDDDRSAAVVLASNLDAATAVVLPGVLQVGPTAQEHAALTVLAPGVLRLFPATPLDVDPELVLCTGGYDPHERDRLAARGLLDPHLPLPRPSGGLRLVRWRSERPLHPGRLHAALDSVADGVIRSVGHLWLASRPGIVVGWDSAGDCLQLGPDRHWDDLRPANRLGLLGDDLDADHIVAVLDSCVLSDEEYAAGPDAWRELPDPFPDWSGALDDDVDAGEQGAA